MEDNIANLSNNFKMKDVMEEDSLHQVINYRSLDANHVNANTSVLVTADNVTIVPSSGKHSVGSSKVKLKDLVDYSWEHKFYPGQILAIHISGVYIAYGIQGKDTGIIRVINLKTLERALIKGIEGMTQDVAFAFITYPVLVACIDSVGDVYVYSVEENQLKALSCCLMLHIKQDSDNSPGGINRIVWCPYVPDDDEQLEDDDPSKLIVTRGNKVHVWNVNVVRAQHGINPITPQTVSEGFLEIEIDNYSIVDLAFSPDGSTVALACSDGGIRFFQIDVQEGQSPVCIHDWRPHAGKPVSCLYFLDNHLDSDCHFWKFAVTGVEGNSEIKIWTCETWSCIQTIKYAPLEELSSSFKLKVAVDITANYILVSDMQRKLLHVLQLKKNKEETEVRVHVISEFFLSYPILSFGIVEAKRDYFIDDSSFEASGSLLINELNETADEDRATMKTIIKLYLVQPRALHECIIVYNSDDVTNEFTNVSNTTNHFEETIHEVSGNKIMNGVCEKTDQHFSPERITQLNTSMDFSSVTNVTKLKPNDKYLPLSVIEDHAIMQSRHVPSAAEEFRSDSRISNDLSRRSTEGEDLACRITIPNKNNQDTEGDRNTTERMEENGNAVVSTGSSPSREVQHILFSSEATNDTSPKNPTKKVENDLPATVWPKIPIPEPENACQNMTDMIINNAEKIRIRNESNNEFKSNKFRNSEIDCQVVTTKIDNLETRVNQLNDLIKSQQQDIKHSLNSIQQHLRAHKEEEKKRRNINNEDKFNEARFVNTISQKVNSIITNEVEYLIKQEINGNVLPSLKNTMDTFGQQLQLKMSQHLSTADQALKEYIVKIVHKKSISDALVNSIGAALPSVISDSFADVFCNVILPRFEKSCHEMFDQVNNLFVDGTREYISVLQNHVRSYEEKQCSILQTKIDEIMTKVNEVAENASFNAIKSFEPELCNSIKAALEEQKRQLETSIININRATSSPFSTIQKVQQQQEQIDFLISQGRINKAIEQVLSVPDLKLLVCLCEKLDPDKVFSEPCKIEQHILLSFIQQLSADLHIQTDLKHRFIESAIMCLDRKHPICEINIPKILPCVRTRLLQYINANPNNKNTRNMKILLMAVDSLLSDKSDHYAV